MFRPRRPPRNPPGIHLDWVAYYQKFKELHGGNPVEYGGRSLFPDSWMYSKDDPKGPEWSPPEDQNSLRLLKIAYWKKRAEIAKALFDDQLRILKTYEDIQSVRSAPLQQSRRASFTDDDGRERFGKESYDVDLSTQRFKLDGLREDVRLCMDFLDLFLSEIPKMAEQLR